MRGEQCRAHVHAELPPERARDRELLQLRLALETVAGLDLDGGRALVGDRSQARSAGVGERGCVRRPRRAHRRQDAAALVRDLRVRRAAQASLEFACAIAGVDEVSVAVDQPRRRPRPAEVVPLRRRRAGRQFALRPDPRDALADDADRAVAHDSPAFAVERREVEPGQQDVEAGGCVHFTPFAILPIARR